jgi:hypothetical protein
MKSELKQMVFGAVVVGLLSSCNEPRSEVKPPPPEPVVPAAQAQPAPAFNQAEYLAQLLHFYAQAPTVTADFIVRVKPPNGNAIIFQIAVACPADGRIRLTCSKLDVDFISALVQPNGDFILELVRSKEIVRGNVCDIHVFDKNGAASGPPFLAYLQLLVNEAKIGPVPERGVTKATPGHVEGKDPLTGLAMTLTVNPDDTVQSKQLFDAPNKEAVRLQYDRYQKFGNLQRPSKMSIVLPNNSNEYTVRLRDLRDVPSISADTMRFVPSKDATEITLEQFLERIK